MGVTRELPASRSVVCGASRGPAFDADSTGSLVIFFLDQSERVSKLTQEMAVYGGLMISANRKALNETAWHNGAA